MPVGFKETQLNNIKDRIVILAGSPEAVNQPALPVFSPVLCEFLIALSHEILKDHEAKQYPDIITFGFFLRKANIEKMKNKYENSDRMGRGLSFHIAPSNVPINFAYTLVTGLLAGNSCIVRASSKDFPQTGIICRLLNSLISKYEAAMKYVCIIQYGHDRTVTDVLSSIADIRVIWGGDSTISEIRKSPLMPRGIEITFADRRSLSVIQSEAFLQAFTGDSMDDSAIKRLCENFFNDTYLYDQNACSSPFLLYWQGNKRNTDMARRLFWKKFHEYLIGKYEIQPSIAVDKLMNSDKAAIQLPDVNLIQMGDNLIHRIELAELTDDIEDFICPGGVFLEYTDMELDALASIINEKYQTMTYFGYEREKLVQFVINHGLKGIDRIVPIGEAADFDLLWDGYSLIETMSRIIYVNKIGC